MPAHRSRLLALTLLLVACGDSEGPAGADGVETTITAAGEGETNAAPLWPLRLGARWGSWVVTEVRKEDGEEVFVLATGEPSTPSAHWPLLVVRDVAIYSLGTAYHRAVIPLLVVPAEARVGMTWETRTADGDLLFVGTVASREERPTAFGTRVVWDVQFAAGGPTEQLDASYPYELREFGSVSPGLLIEGIGPERFDDVVVPLDFQASSPAPRRLEAIAFGDEPMIEVDPELGFLTTYVSATIDPLNAGGAPLVKVAGVAPFYVNPPGYFALVASSGCGTLKDGVLEDVPSVGTEERGLSTCPDGGAVIVDDAGTSQLPEVASGRSTGLVIVIEECIPGQPCPPPRHLNTYSLAGIFRDAAGKIRVFGENDDGLVLGGFEAAGLPGMAADAVARGYDRIANVERLGALLETRGIRMQPDVRPFAWLAVDGDRLGVARFRADDRLFWYRVEHGQVTGAHASLPVPMRSVTASAHGRDTLSLSPDGRVDRVEVTADGVDVRPLGRVALPEDTWLAGGFVQGDELFAVVQRGFLRLTGGILAPPPVLGAPWLYRVPLPAQAAVAPMPAIFGVRASSIDDDVEVCWRAAPGAGQADLTGWTLRGPAPLGVLPVERPGDETCVLVAHDPRVSTAVSPGVEAKIPGVGRVLLVPRFVERVETPRPASFVAFFDVLRAAGDDVYRNAGGAARADFEYGDMGLPLRAIGIGSAPELPSGEATPDNHGRWAIAAGSADAIYIEGEEVVRSVALDGNASIVRAYNDGGALAKVQGAFVRIAADGRTTTVPPIATAQGDVAPWHVFRTGAACSFSGVETSCRGADGVVRTGPLPPQEANFGGDVPAHETLDAHLAQITSSSTDPEASLRYLVFDPETATFVHDDIPGISASESARCNWFALGDGRDGLVCQRPAANPELPAVVRVFRVDGAGLHPVNVPFAAAHGSFLRVALWGTPSAMLVYRQRESDWELVRVPTALVVEGAHPACTNGEDDDADGIEDLMDLGCAGRDDPDERDPTDPPACGDGRDNDGDQRVDFPEDPECQAAGGALEGEAPSCDGACAALNGEGTPKHVDISSGGSIAARWMPTNDMVVTRLEAYSGAVVGPAWIAIYAHDPATDGPGTELARVDFTLDAPLGWQGATLPAAVTMRASEQVWWAFGYPKDAQPPYADKGTAVDVRVIPPGATGWRSTSWQAIMMRVFCCE